MVAASTADDHDDHGHRGGRPRVVVTRQLPGGALDRLAQVAEVDVWPGRLPPTPGQLRDLAT